MVRWECITPFGSDVVPDVYAMRAGRIGIDRGGRGDRVVGDEVGERQVRTRARIADHRHPLQIGELGAHRVEVGDEVEVAEVIGGHERLHARALQDVRDFLGSVEVHDRHDDRAEVRDCVERRRGLQPVRELERNCVAGLHAARLQPGRDPARQRVDLAERAAVRVAVGANGERLGRGVVQAFGKDRAQGLVVPEPFLHVPLREIGVDPAQFELSTHQVVSPLIRASLPSSTMRVKFDGRVG